MILNIEQIILFVKTIKGAGTAALQWVGGYFAEYS